MPELPDIAIYIECLERRVVGRKLRNVRLFNPFLLRSFDPPLTEVEGRTVRGLRRLGKRIVLEFEGELFLVLHLRIAGRLLWKPVEGKPPGRIGLATFEFETGTLVFTEAGTKRRASVHAVRGEEAILAHRPDGVEPLECSAEQFREALRRENHTLKRSLTSPRLFSGIGNAYSDEILHAARLSPLTWTSRLTDEECERLFEVTRQTLTTWIDRLRIEVGDGFPKKVTAFRPDMAVHGRFGLPCPACGTSVQRIRYADNETNYCPRCQTGGKVLADRALSRLLKGDWPATIEEWESGHGR